MRSGRLASSPATGGPTGLTSVFVISQILSREIGGTIHHERVERSQTTMRSTLILLALACTPAFCQDDAGQKLDDNLRQRLTDILNPQSAPSGTVAAPQPLRLSVRSGFPQLCSIPLLNVTAPGKPVPMPGLKPRALPPQGFNPAAPNANPRNMPATPRPLDRMSIVVPAPACPADFGHSAAPDPAHTPATKP